MADGAGDELALTGQTGGANTTSEAASEQQIMLLQLQLKIAEAEREKQRMELEVQRLQSQRSAEPGEVDSSFAVAAKADEDRRLKFAGLLKGVLAPMPSQEALVPSWFEDVEATLESYEVPREWPIEVVKLAESYDESRKNRPAVVSSTGAPVVNLTAGEAVASSQAKKANWDARIRKQCFKCHATGHIAKQCPTRETTEARLVKGRDRSVIARVAFPQYEKEASQARIGLPKVSKVIGTRGVTLTNAGRTLHARVDSGADITVVRKAACQKYESAGSTIKLTGAFGEQVIAELAYVPLTATEGVPLVSFNPSERGVLCALTDRLVTGVDVLIALEDYDQLLKERVGCEVQEDIEMRGEEVEEEESLDELEHTENALSCAVEAESLEGGNAQTRTTRQQFREAQLADESLREAWAQAWEGTHGMTIRDELLFHQEPIAGHQCCQLVLPSDRRSKGLKMAHDSAWAGHLGERKTLQRIKGSFFWPSITRDVREYCRSCLSCQVRSPARTLDRVPITPLARPETAFQVVNMDCIGPIDPPSARGHRYALCVVDVNTRWPEVVCLRTLIAKATCDALLEIFARLGVPEVVCSDQGTNFTAKVTQQLLSKLGACPRFSTPVHPQSNGLVERWNGTFKSMLFHIVREHGREWDKFVPFLLWAYREVPNVTTGKSPFELMYGRVPVGPLSILQKTWSGDWAVPDTLGVSAEEYLSRLRERLIEANARAEDSTTVEQCRYASRYNLRATDKQFREGQQVLWLEREGEGKLVAKWKGPAKVVRKLRPYSYLIEMEDGTSRSVHANKLRAYHARVGAVGLIFEGDSDFGDIQTSPTQGERNHRIPLAALSHLKPSQRAEVVALVTRHGQVFGDRPGRCTVGMHKIKIKEGAAREPVHPDKVPMSFRKEVERQVQELLAWDLIYPVESPHAYSIVCVSKKDGGLRLCCDYRKLNSITEPDAFPMSPPSELLLQVAKAKYITLIDMLRGYWQIPLDEQAQAITAFVTPVREYAWRTKRELRNFLGLANYYRQYVPEYARIVLPPTNLTNRRTPQQLPWDTEAQSAFENIKDCLKRAASLYAPDPNRSLGHDRKGGLRNHLGIG
ncbi:uncharacterized protein LOC121837265 [Ixodes scapularis]|uniref:uncharacterized protein LOC121837265 n=1 Tax=Ixodes scapularis TaxID=6945 RepID=UPI001C38C94C|nr:uncharacterized protein LOC121837265 [Ixodes scapularis]